MEQMSNEELHTLIQSAQNELYKRLNTLSAVLDYPVAPVEPVAPVAPVVHASTPFTTGSPRTPSGRIYGNDKKKFTFDSLNEESSSGESSHQHSEQDSIHSVKNSKPNMSNTITRSPTVRLFNTEHEGLSRSSHRMLAKSSSL